MNEKLLISILMDCGPWHCHVPQLLISWDFFLLTSRDKYGGILFFIQEYQFHGFPNLPN